jgi:Flp pilus assembly protein TadG
MMFRARADQQGQTLIVVAICVAVLVGGLALAVDWGFGMAQRRVMQNVADASALAAGKRLATSVIKVNNAVAFSVTQEQTWCTANAYANPSDIKKSFAPMGVANDLQLFYGDAANPTVWTTGATTCTGNTPVPSSTVYVRAAVSVTFQSLVASTVGHSSSVASASARVRLSGTPVPLTGGPMWAMVRHYNPTDFNNTCTSNPCDPTDPNQVQPKLFWDANAADVAFGQFKGLIDFSHFSPSFNTQLSVQTLQLITQGDSSAHAPNPLQIDRSGQNQCPFGQDAGGNKLWDSWGEANANNDEHCSIPNWVYYGFRGTLSLDSHWSGGSLPAGQESPTSLGTRSVCSPRPDPAPSCDDPTMGDWVETAGGTIASLTDVVRAAVSGPRGSSAMPFSNKLVPGTSTPFGKGLVVLVFLWECGEKFSKNGVAGARWDLLVPGGPNPDCSQLNSAPDRVHLFTVAPFTIYEGTISSGSVKGYWGGLFGSPDSCPTCALNALANTAVMVPDN